MAVALLCRNAEQITVKLNLFIPFRIAICSVRFFGLTFAVRDAADIPVPAFFVYLYCVAVESDCWTSTYDVHGFGGVPRNMTTLDECLAVCISNTTCVAVDWEPSYVGKSCWILTSTDTAATLDDGFITHYELDRACLGQSLLPTITPY